MSSKNKTQVIIAGKIYTLSGYESEEYLQKVAAYLNGKITEFRGMDGYHRLSQEMRSILMNLNIADDYFKVRKKIEELEEELSEKEKELYEFRHEMITTQVRLENAEKEKNALEEKNAQLQEELIRLRAQTDKTEEK
ncbi:MAG: cell division protein ZapA [Lachnospiraceae bacterium]|jgi:cell division protein ZapA